MTISLAGICGSGKDSFFSLLSQKVNCRRVALADELRRELSPFIIDKFNIDLFRCDRTEKDLVRPLLVEYARIKRNQTQGRYFIEKVDRYIKCIQADTNVVITDLRYSQFARDELYWVKNELNGVVIHIKKHKLVNGVKVYTESPIADERLNDPILEKAADYRIDWPEVNDISELSCYADATVAHFNLT